MPKLALVRSQLNSQMQVEAPGVARKLQGPSHVEGTFDFDSPDRHIADGGGGT